MSGTGNNDEAQTNVDAMEGSDSAAALMRQCYRIGQTEFKRIAWSEVAFARAWTESATSWDQDEPITDQALRDEYLRLACLQRLPGALTTLEADYILPLQGALGRRGADAELIEETLQLVRHKLLLGDQPALRSYRSTGHLRAWLQVVATRTLQDVARQRGVRWSRQAALMDQLVAPAVQPDLQLQKSELDELFVEALREVVQGLPERERYALRMHLLAGWNVSQIGEALATHRATAARWIVAAKEQVSENVRKLLAERLDLSQAELNRLFTLLSTNFDARLSQVFKTMPRVETFAPNDEDEPVSRRAK